MYTYCLSSQLDEKLFALEGDFHYFQPRKQEHTHTHTHTIKVSISTVPQFTSLSTLLLQMLAFLLEFEPHPCILDSINEQCIGGISINKRYPQAIKYRAEEITTSQAPTMESQCQI